MSKPDLVTSAEAADILGVTVKTVNAWAAEGKLPVAHKLPGVRGANLFLRSQVVAIRDAARASAGETNGAVA